MTCSAEISAPGLGASHHPDPRAVHFGEYAPTAQRRPSASTLLEAAVAAAEMEQRLAVERAHLLDPADVDDVVARVVLRNDATVDVHGHSAQERRARAACVGLEPVESLVLVLLDRQPVPELLLVAPQHD